MRNYQLDREWESSYQSQVMSILNTLIPHLAVLEIASDEIDKKRATDFTLRLRGGDIAVRLRRPYYNFRDLTIRARRDNGVKTELAKIKEGYAFRYFYGWTDDEKRIAEWMLVDLDKVREKGILEKDWPLKPNKDPRTGKLDGTHFIPIPAKDLHDAGCLLEWQLKTIRKVNPHIAYGEGYERAEQGYTHRGQPRDEYLRKQLEDIEKFRHMQGRGEDDD